MLFKKTKQQKKQQWRAQGFESKNRVDDLDLLCHVLENICDFAQVTYSLNLCFHIYKILMASDDDKIRITKVNECFVNSKAHSIVKLSL